MRFLIPMLFMTLAAFSQTPPIDPGVSHELAKWRAAHYSDVRYRLDLSLEKMSPVLKGTMEVRVNVSSQAVPTATKAPPIILDWRRIRGHEEKSAIANVSINGREVTAEESNEHLIFRDGVVVGENVIKLDFTSPILPSGSAITRYIDKEDGSEYLYSLFVPSDASTAFPVFDQPDLKARFKLTVHSRDIGRVVSNGRPVTVSWGRGGDQYLFPETKPISTYVFAFAVGPFHEVADTGGNPTRVQSRDSGEDRVASGERLRTSGPKAFDTSSNGGATQPSSTSGAQMDFDDLTRRSASGATTGYHLSAPLVQKSGPVSHIYVRKSQLAKFKPHADEVFRLNREAVKYFEEYFDYKFPFPKYDLVLIPEFPFGGMEHAGATFLREASIIFPQEPTKSDIANRATLIFHEAAHQWFGDTVTMRWFDDLWLKEGFATFTAYKAMERIMPEMNSWKVFYERIKQGAYQTDSTRGTTAIYQPIPNLSAAKSAYGNIVYNKAPAFLRQAEFYLGEDKFRTAVRALLKKHEFANAGWEDLVREFGMATNGNLTGWAETWVKQAGLPTFRLEMLDHRGSTATTRRPSELKLIFSQHKNTDRRDAHVYGRAYDGPVWQEALQFYYILADGTTRNEKITLQKGDRVIEEVWGYNLGGAESKRTRSAMEPPRFVFTNYGDYGYGIFLLDDKSRDYVLKNIHNEGDPFLRSMMWGSLWDSVREGELDPKDYVELVIRVQSASSSSSSTPLKADDETTVASLLNRVGTAMTYYIGERERDSIAPRLEALLIEKMRTAPTLGQRLTFYRAFLNVASSENARSVLKDILNLKFQISDLKLKTKDRFDIVTKLASLNDPDAEKLLADLEKTETSDDAKRYAYAARAAFPTKETKEKYWGDFTANKEISESWIEAAFGPFNSVRHADLTLPYLEQALKELPNHKRNRKIFFVNGWLGAFIGGQRSDEALAIVNKFLADNPNLDRDLRLKILENVDIIERAVKIRKKHSKE